jgi:2-oxoglutarate ferredoxin oxidoreductase subunit beta
VLLVSGIGCSSNIAGFLSLYGYHGLHGRAVPVATGAKLANPELTVIVAGGDGDGYGIGVGHFVHAMRRNLDLTYVVMNNEIYGLTTGQASPTSERDHRTKSTPEGVIENPINPIALAIASGATFVARGFSGDVKTLTDVMVRAIKHEGFALVDVMSPCVTYNKVNTYDWFRKRVYVVDKEGHNPKDIHAAWARAIEWPNLDGKRDRVPTGVIYEANYPTYEALDPTLARHGPPAKQTKLVVENPDDVLKEFY